jgi:hypothetical protein
MKRAHANYRLWIGIGRHGHSTGIGHQGDDEENNRGMASKSFQVE